MKPVQILMDEDLLQTVDREAKRQKSNRSTLVRAALVAYLKTARRRTLDERYRRGYEQSPEQPEDISAWEDIQQWPED